MGRYPKGSWKFDGCKGSFFLRGKNNIIWYRRSRYTRFSTGLPYTQKNKLIAGQRIAKEETRDLPFLARKLTLKQAYSLYIEHIDKRTHENTKKNYIEVFNRVFPNQDILLDSYEIRDIIQELKSRDVSNVTISNYLRTIKIFFNFLIEKDLLTKNPVKKSDFPKIKPKPIEIFTKSELDRMFEKAKQTDFEFYLFLMFTYKTAFRVNEALKLTKADIMVGADWRPQIILGSSKYGDKVDLFPLTETIVDILKQVPNLDQMKIDVPIFFKDISRRAIQKKFDTIMKACDVPKHTTNDTSHNGRLFHTLRKTRITEWIKEGISVHGLEKLSRDNYKTVRKYYDAVQTDTYDDFVK